MAFEGGMSDLFNQRYPRLEGEDYQKDLKRRRGGLLIGRKEDHPEIERHVQNILRGNYTDDQIETLSYRNPGIRATLLGAANERKTQQRFGQYFDPGRPEQAFIDEAGEAFGDEAVPGFQAQPEGLISQEATERNYDPEGAMLEALSMGRPDLAKQYATMTGGASQAKLSTTILGARAAGIPVKGFNNITPEAAQSALDKVQSPISYEMFDPQTQGKRRVMVPRSQFGGINVPTGQTEPQKIEQTQRGARAIMSQANKLVDKLWKSETMTGGLAQASELKLKQLAGTNPDVSQYVSLREGFMALLIRALGEKGTLAEGDIGRARALWPSFRDSRSVAKAKIQQVNQILDGVLRGQSLVEATQTTKPKKPVGKDWSIKRLP